MAVSRVVNRNLEDAKYPLALNASESPTQRGEIAILAPLSEVFSNYGAMFGQLLEDGGHILKLSNDTTDNLLEMVINRAVFCANETGDEGLLRRGRGMISAGEHPE